MRLLPTFVLLLFITACHSVPVSLLMPSPVPGPTGIAGHVNAQDGTPAVGAQVYAYRSAKGGMRGPADFAAEVDAHGDYFLDLVEGKYHLVARMRQGGGDAGPPRPGDAWALFSHNPLPVVRDMTSRADFVLHGITQPMLLKEGSLTSGDTGFSGQIVDSDGRPVSGAIPLAYRTPDHRRIPDYTAAATAGDGRFILYVPQGGHFCLAARTRTRGQPLVGEPYGILADGEAGCRDVERGTILDVGTIMLRPYRRE